MIPMSKQTVEAPVFTVGDKVAFINASNKLILNATVVEEYVDEQGKVRVRVNYVGHGGYTFGCCPTRDRVGFTDGRSRQ
jgi:hypothetical protein